MSAIFFGPCRGDHCRLMCLISTCDWLPSATADCLWFSAEFYQSGRYLYYGSNDKANKRALVSEVKLGFLQRLEGACRTRGDCCLCNQNRAWEFTPFVLRITIHHQFIFFSPTLEQLKKRMLSLSWKTPGCKSPGVYILPSMISF
jgi:hypothetical protein